jgi:murein DD-endopeptidase MepM/ murein hydrolase activator NlpD
MDLERRGLMPDRTTPWRQLGATTRAGWEAWFRTRGSPMLAEAGITYEAAKPHHKLIAGMLWAESQAAKDMTRNPYSSMNPLNHRNVDNPAWYYGGKPGPEYMVYPDWATNIRACLKRLTDPGYKNGVYVGKDSLIEMIGTYAPASDGNQPENYVATILLIANELPSVDHVDPKPEPQPGQRITWRDVAKKADIRVSQPFRDPSPDTYGPRYCLPSGVHVGLDIGNMPRGTELLSLTEGVVEYRTSGQVDDYYRPTYLIVKRDNGHRILYGHMWAINVDKGQRVRVGTYLGDSGEQTRPGTMTPDGTGPHLHLEVWVPDDCPSGYRAVDPATYDYGTKQGEGGDVEPTKPTPGRYSTNVPGLPGGPLVTDYSIRIRMIPQQFRVNRKAFQPRRSVQHGTGNASNPSAWNEAGYFVDGAEGRGVSVHACADHTEVVVCLPFDEQGVHAGDAFGNQHGYACEMIEATSTWNDASKRGRLIHIAADFMGRCAARLGVQNPNKHADYGNPGCPAKLLDNGGRYWDIYARLWQQSRADELKRMEGEVEPPTPVPPKPAPPKPDPPKPPVEPDPDEPAEEWHNR